MGLVSRVLMRREDGDLEFFCPGCKMAHKVYLSGRVTWSWDGNVEAPTFSPSLSIGGVSQPTKEDEAVFDATGKYSSYKPRDIKCHLFVRGGMLEFLNDSNHHLAGQTVPMVDFHPDDI